MTKRNINKLQNVQNFTARIITRLQKCDHNTPVLTELKWLSIEFMLIYRDCILVFKCLRGLAPDYPANKFKKRSEIHNKDTWNKNKIDIPGYRTATGHLEPSTIEQFQCGIPYPKGSLSLQTLYQFKKELMRHL